MIIKTLRFLLVFITIINISVFAANQIQLDQLPEIPPLQNMGTQPGVAGAFAGISNNALLIAGGANFPKKLPWEGGTKIYHNDIYVLHLEDENNPHWHPKTFALPLPVAYGASLTLNQGVLCIGGNDQNSICANVFIMKWDPESESIKITDLPDLPVPLCNHAAVQIDQTVYVLGGKSTLNGDQTRHFYSLDLSKMNSTDFQWQTLDPWPGPPRKLPVAVVQSNGVNNNIYLFSGRNETKAGIDVLTDGYAYDPVFNTWKNLAPNGETQFPVMAGTGFAIGANNIVFPGAADGSGLLKEQKIKQSLANERPGSKAYKELEYQLQQHLVNHKGFNREIRVYNTITSKLYTFDTLQVPTQVTTSLVPWKDKFILPSGEIHPGVRTPKISLISIPEGTEKFGWINSMVLVIYFSILAVMGWYFSKRQKSTNDFFKGGGRIPWWAAGLSLFGTALSAITFMAIPAKTFTTDWSYFMLNMGIFMIAPVIVILFVPYYRKLNITTAYEYLEVRFNLLTRLIGSLTFIIFQIGRMGIVLFLPSIALNVVTGIDIFTCILLMGIFSLIYTAIGGIEAVIWTDVLQVIVLLGGALLSLILIIVHVPHGLTGIVETGIDYQKFNILNMVFDLKQPGFWTVIIASIFTNITTYGTDQTMVQRYLTVNSTKAASKTVWTNAIMVIPATLLFFTIGTALFVFYRQNPQQISLTLKEADAIFPWYIMNNLPAGVSGLLIAGIFAASMSSLSSSINSAATAYINDIHRRFGKGSDSHFLKAARTASFIVGIAGILFAIFMATWDIKSLWDEFNKVLGLVLGSLGGVFLLGIVSKKANGTGAILGIAASIIVQYLVGVYKPVHVLLYTTTGFLTCFITGWLFSFLQRKN